MNFFAYFAIGEAFNNHTGPILLPSYPLAHIKLHVKYGSNPTRAKIEMGNRGTKLLCPGGPSVESMGTKVSQEDFIT